MQQWYFLRHASAAHNEEYDKHRFTDSSKGEVVIDKAFHDARLTMKGIEQVISERDKILSFLHTIDVILVSPLRRALETLLFTLNGLNTLDQKSPKLFVVGSLTELELENERKCLEAPIYNQVTPVTQLRKELKSLQSPWLDKIDFLTHYLEDKEQLHVSRDNQKKLSALGKVFELYLNKNVLVIGHYNSLLALTGSKFGRYECKKTPYSSIYLV